MTRLSLSLVLGFMCWPIIAAAQSQTTDIRPHALRLMGAELTAQFMGKTHEGAYNFNSVGLARNNYIETHFKDGRTDYKEKGFSSQGVWFVSDDALCFVYENNNMTGGCFRVYRVENCFYFYSDEYREKSDELDRDYWTARSVHKGEIPQCEAAIS